MFFFGQLSGGRTRIVFTLNGWKRRTTMSLRYQLSDSYHGLGCAVSVPSRSPGAKLPQPQFSPCILTKVAGIVTFFRLNQKCKGRVVASLPNPLIWVLLGANYCIKLILYKPHRLGLWVEEHSIFSRSLIGGQIRSQDSIWFLKILAFSNVYTESSSQTRKKTRQVSLPTSAKVRHCLSSLQLQLAAA